MLLENTLWYGVVDKVQVAIDRIRQFEPPEGYYVAFSGGKDSIVVLDLVKRAGVKYDAHYNLTTVDPPELVYFIREHHSDVEKHMPNKTMWQLIERKGFPSRKMRYCCAILKESGGKGRLCVTGVRREESHNRSKRKMVEQCYRDPSKRYLNPIIDWSSHDVWQYIHGNKLPYCSLYDEGFERLGCIMCPLSNPKQIAREAARWPKYAEAYQRAALKSFEYKKERGLSLPPNWTSGTDMYEWWIKQASAEKENPDQNELDYE
ncbi:MAG: phosphoadenosine phosphosulfate reductase [Caproiciproducens sp.]|jgi:phosphoadenosine phosphosulfate reductase|nr:phosphoadenosine phosphosulfate reductase [Caproiciproducens sp.]